MRYSIMIAGLVAGLLATPALAESKVAVIDTPAVIAASIATKKATEKFEASTKVQRDAMEKIKADIQGLQAKYQKDGATMSAKDKQDLQKQAEEKAGEFQKLGQAVMEAKQKTEQDLQATLAPKIRAVIDELRKANKYDIVVERQNVVMSYDPAVDITQKVIDKVNAATPAPAGK